MTNLRQIISYACLIDQLRERRPQSVDDHNLQAVWWVGHGAVQRNDAASARHVLNDHVRPERRRYERRDHAPKCRSRLSTLR